MRRILTISLALLLLLCCVFPVFARTSNVIYSEDAQRFFFAPGSRYSPTDLFAEFKDVMPGDHLRQQIEIKNPTSNDCKIKIYLRARGAFPNSEEFLSQMNLTVEMADHTVLFDAPANRRAQLRDWVYLGTLYSGGEGEMIVTLEVPVTMDDRFQKEVGFLEWEFAVEELPVEPSDPKPPFTGDTRNPLFWVCVMCGSAALLIWLLPYRKKKKEE